MKLCFYVDEVTPHLLPLAEKMVEKLGIAEVRYVYCKRLHAERTGMGWQEQKKEWILYRHDFPQEAERWILGAEVLFCRIRDVGVWKKRDSEKRITLYMSERWFRPRHLITVCGRDIMLPGVVCIFKPGFFSMMVNAIRFFTHSKFMIYLPAGIYAAQDMARICGIFNFNVKCLFKAPSLSFEKRPFGRLYADNQNDARSYCLSRMRMWAYYVAPSTLRQQCFTRRRKADGELHIIWAGRLIALKRLDVVIRAIKAQESAWKAQDTHTRFFLDIYGDGPYLRKILKLSTGCEAIRIYSSAPYNKIREIIRAHDVLVLSSNEEEGWGAVINEALEEGVEAVGTCDAGASATLLQDSRCFRSGDWRSLLKILREIDCSIGTRADEFLWTAEAASSILTREYFTV